jgi:hypothetical protein
MLVSLSTICSLAGTELLPLFQTISRWFRVLPRSGFTTHLAMLSFLCLNYHTGVNAKSNELPTQQCPDGIRSQVVSDLTCSHYPILDLQLDRTSPVAGMEKLSTLFHNFSSAYRTFRTRTPADHKISHRIFIWRTRFWLLQ